MFEKIMGTIINIFFLLISSVIICGFVMKIVKNTLSAQKSVNAMVIEKQSFSQQILSKTQAPRVQQKFVIIFMTESKKLSFYVSPFTYNSIKEKQSGILTYKGDKLIDFT